MQRLRRTDCRHIIVRTTVQYTQLCRNAMSHTKLSEDSLLKFSKNSVELRSSRKNWLLIVEIINVIAEVLNCDAMVLTEQVISNDKQIKAVKQAFDRLTPAA